VRSRDVEHVRRAIRAAAIRLPDVFAPGTRLVVAFSGGQDSTCLLHALAHAHRTLDLLAVHVDHGLRPDSAESAQRVSDAARTIGVRCEVVRVEVAKRGSVQQAARVARYAALAAAAQAHDAKAILVAHTADDQAETLLLNLLRGTGLLGLAGMRMDEVRAARLVRPLLDVSRSTTLAYCTHFGLLSTIVEDASNQTRVYTRNRVRLDLLPLLREFNPAVHEVLSRMADLVAEDLEVLDALASDLYTTLQNDGTYDLRAFRAQPRALQRRLLRLGLQHAGLSLKNVADRPLEDALNLLQTGQPNQTYHLPYGVEVCIGHQTFVLRQHGNARAPSARNTWESVGSRV